MTYFIGQIATLTIETGVDVTTISSADIYYRKPDWTESHWTASYTTGTTVHYDITTELDQAGMWTFWVVLTYPGGETESTCACAYRVYRPGYGGCCG
jgi:hypothetical protein